jgi:hypothetical protein
VTITDIGVFRDKLEPGGCTFSLFVGPDAEKQAQACPSGGK